jgi:group I intron endonuclease
LFEIYLLINEIDEKIYVGQTRRGVTRRKLEHIKDSEKGSRHRLHTAMRKWGSNHFTISTIARVKTREESDREERFWIDTLHTNDPKIGYNMTLGGDGVDDPTGEVAKKIAAATKKYLSVPEHNSSYRKDVSTDEIVHLYEEGWSGKEIAKKFGISESCIYRRMGKRSTPLRRHLTNMDEEICRLYLSGCSTPLIAEQLGMSVAKVNDRLNKQGVEKRKTGSRPYVGHRQEKKCWACLETKPLDDFYHNKTRPDGHSDECKTCNRKYNIDYKTRVGLLHKK